MKTFIRYKLKLYLFIFLSLTCILVIVYYLKWPHVNTKHKTPRISEAKYIPFEEVRDNSFHGARIVHLDLKGAPPKISYYEKLFPLLKRLGATGLLIEYEDMFPYNGPLLESVPALNAYTLSDIETINRLAKESQLNIIPLVPTFGHMEFILKLKQFTDYREEYDSPQTICPTYELSKNLIIEMLEQILKAHPYSNIIHIGADEVYSLGRCDRCSNIMNKFNLSKNMLFAEHIKFVTDYIHIHYPNFTILMWDDEFRRFSSRELKSAKLNSAVQPVIWKYTKDVYDDLGPSLWNLYSDVFPNVWIGSAFKGATGSNSFTSDVTHYVQNHRSWLYVLLEYKTRFNFRGIIFTGWQRYDHFAILCELLPVGIPSLAMSLRVIMGNKDSILSPPTQVAKILHCKQPYGLMGPAFGYPRCSYPGADILENVIKLQQIKHEFENIMDYSSMKGWLNDYNIKTKFSNTKLVHSLYVALNRIRMELAQMEKDITVAMMEVYDNYTIDEWKETFLEPLQKQVIPLVVASKKILSRKTWPRRPLTSESIKTDDEL